MILFQRIYNIHTVSVNKITISMEYRCTDLRPFHVIVDAFNKDQKGISRIHPMSIEKLLFEQHAEISRNIGNVKKIGINRLRMELNNRISANKLLGLYDLYIPRCLLQSRGIIRGVDTELSAVEIKEVLRGPLGINFEVLEIQINFVNSLL